MRSTVETPSDGRVRRSRLLLRMPAVPAEPGADLVAVLVRAAAGPGRSGPAWPTAGSGCGRSGRRRQSTTGSRPSSVGQFDAAAYVVDRPARDAGRGQDVEPLLRGPGRQPLEQQRPQRPRGCRCGPRRWRTARRRRPSGMPSTAARRRNWPSLPAITISSPSPVGSGSYGNRDRCALPIRCGTTPPATYAEVWLTSADSAVDSRLVSIVLALAGARRGGAARRGCRWPSAARSSRRRPRCRRGTAGRPALRSGSSGRTPPARAGRSRAARHRRRSRSR